jgi:hypothetical protein
MVAALGELTGDCALQRMRTKMILDPTGRRLLRDRPLINTGTVNLQRLREMPKNTLGRGFEFCCPFSILFLECDVVLLLVGNSVCKLSGFGMR